MEELLGAVNTPSNCLTCGNGVTGRAGKKFCSDPCRAQYNNRKKKSDEALILKINRILRKNWGVLGALYESGHTTTTKEAMKQMGFNFEYQTQRVVDFNKGIDYYSCYEWYYTINYIGAVQITRNDK